MLGHGGRDRGVRGGSVDAVIASVPGAARTTSHKSFEKIEVFLVTRRKGNILPESLS
ncbi:MAG TPA: hypothetical protein VHW45_20170 [Candidatus Sulfotelmatobacter sp.]|jgi:hypothetical protein|nr:hypothetical protein [Candidatus Sulfotelmatobacter sp.]